MYSLAHIYCSIPENNAFGRICNSKFQLHIDYTICYRQNLIGSSALKPFPSVV